MQLGIDDLLCPSCHGYAHPFLDQCPACGAARRSRLDEVASGASLGLAALLGDGSIRARVRSVAMRYPTRAFGEPSEDLAEVLPVVAASMAYRASVAVDRPTAAAPAGVANGEAASVAVSGGMLVVRPRPGAAAIAAVPLSAVVATTALAKGHPGPGQWAGVVVGGRRLLDRRPIEAGDLLVTWASADGPGQLALSNRRGLLAPRARPDHYELLAEWLGLLAAATAEARWMDVGVAAYATEAGLADPPQDTATPAAAAGTPATGHAPGAVGVRASLEELEQLRSARLVTDEEYAAKRREILARL